MVLYVIRQYHKDQADQAEGDSKGRGGGKGPGGANAEWLNGNGVGRAGPGAEPGGVGEGSKKSPVGGGAGVTRRRPNSRGKKKVS